ncbi:MAG: hypothetical protein N3B18_07700 [Desulfobacterota bacterium]|nr:hypothetical protein [Thermodesulfobacteriota bacterium]
MKISIGTIYLSIAILAAFLAKPASAATKKVIGPGDIVPEHTFRYSLTSKDCSYLGITQGLFSFFTPAELSLQNIPAEIFVIELFNIYCTSCQAQAPVLNTVFASVANTEGLRDKVRFIGIGVGNTGKEIDRFRKEKAIAFPLIPDTDFAFYNAMGDPGGTPFTVIAKRTSKGLTVIAANLGLVKDATVILQQIQEAAMPGAAGKPLILESDLPDATVDRMLELRLSENALLEKVIESMRAAFPQGTAITQPVKLSLAQGQTVYRAEAGSEQKTVLFSQVISRKPVCDVCHGVHFIITFDQTGTIRSFTPLHITKYGNALWSEGEISFMASRLIGRSLQKGIEFDPEADAVSGATMSSALIVNSLKNLKPVVEELLRYAE